MAFCFYLIHYDEYSFFLKLDNNTKLKYSLQFLPIKYSVHKPFIVGNFIIPCFIPQQPCANQVISDNFAVSPVLLEALVPSVAASVIRIVQMICVTMSMDVLNNPEAYLSQPFQVHTLKDTDTTMRFTKK